MKGYAKEFEGDYLNLENHLFEKLSATMVQIMHLKQHLCPTNEAYCLVMEEWFRSKKVLYVDRIMTIFVRSFEVRYSNV